MRVRTPYLRPREVNPRFLHASQGGISAIQPRRSTPQDPISGTSGFSSTSDKEHKLTLLYQLKVRATKLKSYVTKTNRRTLTASSQESLLLASRKFYHMRRCEDTASFLALFLVMGWVGYINRTSNFFCGSHRRDIRSPPRYHHELAKSVNCRRSRSVWRQRPHSIPLRSVGH